MAEEPPPGEIPLARRWDAPAPAGSPPFLPNYASMGNRRPTAITVIGILSIILGSFGILANLVTGLEGGASYVMKRMSATLPTARPPTTMAAPATVPTPAAGAGPSTHPLYTYHAYAHSTTTAVYFPFAFIDSNAAIVVAIESCLSLGLAIFLLLAGIMALRSSPAAGLMHLFYAIVKIPLAIVGGIALTRLSASMIRMMVTPPARPFPPRSGVDFSGFFVCTAGMIYPIALLILLGTGSIRKYYRAARTAA